MRIVRAGARSQGNLVETGHLVSFALGGVPPQLVQLASQARVSMVRGTEHDPKGLFTNVRWKSRQTKILGPRVGGRRLGIPQDA